MGVAEYGIIFAVLLAVMIGTVTYVHPRRKQLDEMHGMMAGMTFGITAGLLTATLYLIPTGDFLTGVIAGSIAGLMFGLPFGKLGGHLGIMEGVIAGPMGGMMGAMLGQMTRPYNIEVFIPFFTFIILITLAGLSYAVHCGVSCCAGKTAKPARVSETFISVWSATAIVVLGISIFLPFQLPEAQSQTQLQSQDLVLPASLRGPPETREEAVQRDGYQEIDLLVSQSQYLPNVIVAKKGTPLKIQVTADKTAGCAREIVFPDFNIRRIIPEDTAVTLELLPKEEGTFKFRCSMDMAHGKLIVV
jgi:heme/copper-type cytochrome/quinol oxidase subunit 2